MRIVFAGLCLALTLVAEPKPAPAKPVCSRQTAGRLWPEAANSDPALAVALSRSGGLEICTRTTWTYRWTSPTIDVKSLRKPR